MDTKITGMLIASAVAGLIGCGGANAAAPAATTGATEAKSKCVGLNACKAKGVCAQEGHACGGQNDCRAKGVTLVHTPDECKAKGGTTL
jgi:hypothetical protein